MALNGERRDKVRTCGGPRGIRKARKKEEKDIARGRAIREQADQDDRPAEGRSRDDDREATETGSHRRTTTKENT